MKKRDMRLLKLFAVLVLIAVGLRVDIDYCKNTAASVERNKLWGITMSSSTANGYRLWLEDEIGINLDLDFADYLEFHPIFPVASTPQGNWLTLRHARQIYNDYPAHQSEVREILLRLRERNPSRLNIQDRHDLDQVRKRAEQAGDTNPGHAAGS